MCAGTLQLLTAPYHVHERAGENAQREDADYAEVRRAAQAKKPLPRVTWRPERIGARTCRPYVISTARRGEFHVDRRIPAELDARHLPAERLSRRATRQQEHRERRKQKEQRKERKSARVHTKLSIAPRVYSEDMISARTILFLIGAVVIVGVIALGATLFAPKEPEGPRTSGTWGSDYARDPSLLPEEQPYEEGLASGNFSSQSGMLPTFAFASPFNRSAALRAATGTDPFAGLSTYLSTLGQGNANGTNGGNGFDLSQFFSFTIGGASPGGRTDIQEVLYGYGNTAGTAIKALDSLSADTNEKLAAFLEEPSDATAEGVSTVAARLTATGERLIAAGEAPSQIAEQIAALAERYADAGVSLELLAEARSDDALLTAIEAYGEKAQALASAFVAVADVFADQGVRFEEGDAGSIFMFSGF